MDITQLDIQTRDEEGRLYIVSGLNKLLIKIAKALNIDEGLVRQQELLIYWPNGLNDLKQKIKGIK
jgi:hypothetical protein